MREINSAGDVADRFQLYYEDIHLIQTFSTLQQTRFIHVIINELGILLK